VSEALTLDRIQAGLERAGASVEVLEGFLRVGIAVPTVEGLWGLVVLLESTSEGDLLAVAPGVATVPGQEGEDPELAEVRALRLVNAWNASKLWPKLYVDDEVQNDGGRMLVGECWVPFPDGAEDGALDRTLSIVMAELRSAVEALATDAQTRPVALIEEQLVAEAAAALGGEGSVGPQPMVQVADGAPTSAAEAEPATAAAVPGPRAADVATPAEAREDLAGWLGLAGPSGQGASAAFSGEPIGTWSLSDLVLGGPPRPMEATGLGHAGNGAASTGAPGGLEQAPPGEPSRVDDAALPAAREAIAPGAHSSATPSAAPAPFVPATLRGGPPPGLSPTAMPPTPPSTVVPPAPAPESAPTAPPPTAQSPTAQSPTAPPPGRPLLWGQVPSSSSGASGAPRRNDPADDDPASQEAERQFKEAMALRVQIADALEAGDLEEGRTLLEQAVPVFREVGLEPQAMLFEVTLGEVYRDLGDLDAAVAVMRHGWSWFNERREIFEADLARVEQSLATTLVQAGQFDEARTLFESARASYTRRSVLDSAAECDRELGAIALRTGGFDEARQRFQAAQSRFERLGLAPQSASARLALGMACALQGDFAEAERAYGAAREAFVGLADQANVAECDFGLGVVAIRTGRPADAVAHYARARETLEALGRSVEVANCDRELAVAALAMGDLESARQRYSSARAAFAALGRDRDVAVCDEGLRAIAVRSGAPI